MSKVACFLLVIVAVVTLSVAIPNRGQHDVFVDDIAHWALDAIGPGHQLIKVNKVKKERVDGTLYHLKLKVRKFKLGGFSETVTCKVKILVYKNDKYLTYQRCLRGRRPIGSSAHRDLH